MDVVRHCIVATAGHIDHGKSALVKALTGTDPDRLPAEKARSISIELGFACLELPSATARCSHRIGVIDVPGHERFIGNMVAGIGALDLALLVVAADDGWMPQTEEHLQILSYAGARRLVVALSKVDRVSDVAGRSEAVRECLSGSEFAEARIVPTSVVTNQGLEELKACLIKELSCEPPWLDCGKPRLAIDRIFSLAGAGTVATGTLIGGPLRRGQSVVIQPGNRVARIRELHSYGRDVEVSVPGARTAVSLPGFNKACLQRGDVLALPQSGSSSTCLDVLLKVSARASQSVATGCRVMVHHGTGRVGGRVELASSAELGAGTGANAQLRLDGPVFVMAGDRLILRDWPCKRTLAGAVVLDPHSRRLGFRREGRQTWLRQVAQSLQSPTEFVAAVVAHKRVVVAAEACQQAPFSAAVLDAAIDTLVRESRIVTAGKFIVDASYWQETVRRVTLFVDDFHLEFPEKAGVPVAVLQRALRTSVPQEAVLNAAIADACKHGYSRVAGVLHCDGHRSELPSELKGEGEAIRRALAAQPLDPPPRMILASEPRAQRALQFLLESGEAVEITKELVMNSSTIAMLAGRIRAYIAAQGPATASELRQSIGTSRRVAIPLLEYLDRSLVTLRQGDRRILR